MDHNLLALISLPLVVGTILILGGLFPVILDLGDAELKRRAVRKGVDAQSPQARSVATIGRSDEIPPVSDPAFEDLLRDFSQITGDPKIFAAFFNLPVKPLSEEETASREQIFS